MSLSHKLTTLDPSSRQHRRTEQTRARLLDAALAVFLERGYDGASLGEITKRADLGTGTYYLYFRDKRSIYEALIRRNVLALRERWVVERDKRQIDGTPEREISLMVELVLDSLLEDRRLARLVLLDGPPLETWLVDEIGREMTLVLGDRMSGAAAVSHFVMGVTLAAARWALTEPVDIAPKRLLARAVAFCAGGVTAINPKAKGRRT